MLDDMPNWLKTTVLGLIILGTCGSLLAIAILYFLKKLLRLLKYTFQKVLPRQVERVATAYKRLREKVMYSYGLRLGKYSAWNPSWGVTFYFAYHLACTVCLLILSSAMTIITLIIVCGTKSSTILTATTFLLTVGALLFGFWSFRHFLFVFLPYHNFLGIIVSEIKSFMCKEEPGTPSNEKDAGSNIEQSQKPPKDDILKAMPKK